MPENPFLKAIYGELAKTRKAISRAPVVREAEVQTDGSLLLVGDTEPLPDLIPHGQTAGARMNVIQSNNRVYPLGDARGGLYYNASRMRDAGYLNRVAATTTADKAMNITVFGSSTVAGLADTGYGGWPRRLRVALAQRGCTVSGTGWVHVGAAINTDPRVTRSDSTVTLVAGRLRANVPQSQWVQFASDVAGTTVQIRYLRNGGGFSYSIDGGAYVAKGASEASPAYGVVTVDGLANSTHTVRVRGDNGILPALVVAVRVHNPSVAGMQVSSAGISGSTTAEWDTLFGTPGQPLMDVIETAPDLTIISVGISDAWNGLNLSTFRDRFASMIDKLRAAGSAVIVNAMPHANSYLISFADWERYVNQLRSVCAQKGVVMIDMPHRWGELSTGIAAGLYPPGELVHPGPSGHVDQAAVIAAFLRDV